MARTYAGVALDEMARQIKKSKKSLYEGWNTMGPDQPRHCIVCGKPIRLSKDSCGFRTMHPRLSWHMECVHNSGGNAA